MRTSSSSMRHLKMTQMSTWFKNMPQVYWPPVWAEAPTDTVYCRRHASACNALLVVDGLAWLVLHTRFEYCNIGLLLNMGATAFSSTCKVWSSTDAHVVATLVMSDPCEHPTCYIRSLLLFEGDDLPAGKAASRHVTYMHNTGHCCKRSLVLQLPSTLQVHLSKVCMNADSNWQAKLASNCPSFKFNCA